MLWRRSRGAGISSRPLAGLGFGWLACLPLSVNAVRKSGLAFDVNMDARAAIARLPESERERASAELGAQVAEAIDELDEADERRRPLASLGRELKDGHGRL
jgi:hypothetical protein